MTTRQAGLVLVLLVAVLVIAGLVWYENHREYMRQAEARETARWLKERESAREGMYRAGWTQERIDAANREAYLKYDMKSRGWSEERIAAELKKIAAEGR